MLPALLAWVAVMISRRRLHRGRQEELAFMVKARTQRQLWQLLMTNLLLSAQPFRAAAFSERGAI
jgi:hypothetical protein